MTARRVLVVAHDINPMLGSEAGAASLWLKILSKRHRLDVITDAKHRGGISREDYGSAAFHYIDTQDAVSRLLRKQGLYLYLYWTFLRRASALIRELTARNDYSLLHCLTPAGVYVYSDLHRYGLPLLIGPIGGGLRVPPGFDDMAGSGSLRPRLRDFYYSTLMRTHGWKEYFRRAERILIGTPHLLEYLPRETHCRTEVVFDAMVEPADYPRAAGSGASSVAICYVGRLEPHKGPELLVEAMKRVVRRRRDVFATLVGEGSLRGELTRRISEAGLAPFVRLAGGVARSDVSRMLAGSDIFCLPTLREPGGLSVLEAMACGLPIITTDYGGPAHSVTEDCGIKIAPTSSEAYVAELERAIHRLADRPDERSRMGANARNRVRAHFSPQAWEERIHSIYASVMGERAAGVELESPVGATFEA
jgi:glycosyltransferase involved in cell wall biosynthesis